MKPVSLDTIVQFVVREVVQELRRQGVTVVETSGNPDMGWVSEHSPGFRNRSETVDMSRYRTPVLTSERIRRLHELTGEIRIPRGTVITPKARQMLRQKGISICFLE